MQSAALKMKAMHMTHGQFILDPISKPPMTERAGGNSSLLKTSMLNGSGRDNSLVMMSQNKGLIQKMISQYDIDKAGVISTANLNKVFKLMGVNYDEKVIFMF